MERDFADIPSAKHRLMAGRWVVRKHRDLETSQSPSSTWSHSIASPRDRFRTMIASNIGSNADDNTCMLDELLGKSDHGTQLAHLAMHAASSPESATNTGNYDQN